MSVLELVTTILYSVSQFYVVVVNLFPDLHFAILLSNIFCSVSLFSPFSTVKKWTNPGLFFVYFRSFQSNNTFLTTNQCDKCPSSIRHRDSNPQPFKRELSPITTITLDQKEPCHLMLEANVVPAFNVLDISNYLPRHTMELFSRRR